MDAFSVAEVETLLIHFEIFQMKKFKDLVKKTFENTKIKDQTVVIIQDFVRGCISLNPKDRPSIDDVLQHKVFGGPKLFLKKKNDIWTNKGESRLRINKFFKIIISKIIFLKEMLNKKNCHYQI